MPESVSRSISTSSAWTRKRLNPAPRTTRSRSSRVVMRIGFDLDFDPERLDDGLHGDPPRGPPGSAALAGVYSSKTRKGASRATRARDAPLECERSASRSRTRVAEGVDVVEVEHAVAVEVGERSAVDEGVGEEVDVVEVEDAVAIKVGRQMVAVTPVTAMSSMFQPG
ncbi:MAG: hypothetical protein R3B49_00625 [Phycisphaerales bacterium]